jgi:hypothetical protein
MASFNDALDRLVYLAQNDATLQTFSQSSWGRALAVKRIFRRRVEVNQAEMPLLMITRPSLESEYRLSGGRENTHMVRLYGLFPQPDHLKAQQDVVEFEEQLDDFLTKNYRIKDPGGNPLVQNVYPLRAANDEGLYHPVYAIVKDVEIEHRR